MAVQALPPALEGLVEDPPVLQNPNYLTYNRVYSTVGNTRILQAEPAVLHFGGFQLGQVFRQTLRIRNVRAGGSRIHIIPPSTPFFKATCDSKKGQLAAGMSEDVVVEFCPQQYRYYYDCVRIHSEEENLLIPIHAYPVMNETIFPSRIDFGKCALGDEAVKLVKVECKVPVEFEFEVMETKPNASFKVEPMRGVVPADGFVEVAVVFCPITLTTEEMIIEVRVSEFNSKPAKCVITGSGLPGVAKDRLLQETLGRATGQLTMDQLDGTRALTSAPKDRPVNAGGGTLRGGAGHGDAYTSMLLEERRDKGARDCRKTGPIKARRPKPPPKGSETHVNGIYVPDTMLMTTADISYVLSQSSGKLRIKDVKEAIVAKKAALAQQQAALDAVLAEGLSEGLHPLERPDIPADVKAALFRMQLQQAEEAAKKVSLGTGTHLGEDLMRPVDIRKTQQLREQQRRQHQLLEEAKATRRLQADMEASGALHLPSTSGSGTEGEGPEAGFKPEWRIIEGSDWAKRTRMLDMFMKAVWRVMYTLRMQKRLERIKDVLNQLGHDKQRLAEEAVNPVLLVTESDRPGTAPTKYLRPELVRVRPLPLYRDVMFQVHEAVPASHYTDFDELAPFQPKVPLEYKLLGYTPEEFPGLTAYLPPLLDQPLMAGAEEEMAGVSLVPSSIMPLLSEYPPLPDACKNMPYITLEVGGRYLEDRVYAQPEPSWGMDAQYLVQPRIYPMHDSTAHESVQSGGIRSMRGAPALCDTWLPRLDAWGVQLGEEVVPRLMSGPDPSDLLEDSPEDADKPTIRPKVPTDADLADYLPQTSRNSVEPAAPAPAAPPRGASAGAGSAAAPAGGSGAPLQEFRLVRQKHVAELEAKKWQAAQDAIEAFQEKLQAYNKDLQRPCYFALQM